MTRSPSGSSALPFLRAWRGRLALAASALLLAACAGEASRREGLSLVADGHYEEGIAKLAEAVNASPKDASIRKDYLSQRDRVVTRLIDDAVAARAADRLDAAEAGFTRVLGIDPKNPAAAKGLADVAADRRHARMLAEAQALLKKGDRAGAKAVLEVVLMENPSNRKAGQLRYQIGEATLKDEIAGPTLNVKGRTPVTLQFRDANLKMVLEALARTAGLNVLVDKDVRNDLRVTIFVRDTPVEETLDLILMQNQLEKRVLGSNTVMVYPINPAKNKEYQELKVRRFAPVNSDAKQVQTMIKTIIKTKDIYLDEKTNAVIMRDTPQAIRLAEKLVGAMDQPEPEVMLDIDVMQVNRDRMMKLGLDLPTSVSWSMPLTGTMTLAQFKSRTAADVAMSGVSVTANAKKTDSDLNSLANPKIRVRNKEKAKILIGTRNPVVSSAATPAGTTGTTVYNTMVQYIETGIRLEVEPTIHLDGEVAIRLNLEVSAPGEQNAEAAKTGTIVFPVTTNTLNTLLQLKDGETQIMGGLIQHQVSSGQTKIPGFGDIPVVGRLFGSQNDTWNNDELVLAITPHIVRNNSLTEADLIELWSGTENNLKFGATNMKLEGSSGVMAVGGAGGTVLTPLIPVVPLPVAPAAPPTPPRTAPENATGETPAPGIPVPANAPQPLPPPNSPSAPATSEAAPPASFASSATDLPYDPLSGILPAPLQ